SRSPPCSRRPARPPRRPARMLPALGPALEVVDGCARHLDVVLEADERDGLPLRLQEGREPGDDLVQLEVRRRVDAEAHPHAPAENPRPVDPALALELRQALERRQPLPQGLCRRRRRGALDLGDHQVEHRAHRIRWSAVGDDLLVAREHGVLHVTLNRPDEGNALTPTQVADLVALFDEAGASLETRAVVLSGAGTTFCRGTDARVARECPAAPPGAPARPVGFTAWLIRTGVQRLVASVRACEKPVVAAVRGL